jgi:predicted dehydrogenase
MEKLKEKQISFGLVGCGNIGKRHASLIKKFGILKAVCDTNAEEFFSFDNKEGINFYTNYSDLLKNESSLDIIAICTPNYLHASQSIQALNAGIDVICEKPMALTKIDCNSMIETAKKKQSKLFIVKQNRFNPPIVLLKELLSTNRMGKIFSVHLNCFWNRNEQYFRSNWRGKKDLDGGTLFTQFSHFVDLFAWLFGEVKEVNGFSQNFSHKSWIEFEDSGVAILKFKSGALASINYTINSYQKNMEGSLTVIGEKGIIKIGGEYLNHIEYFEIEGESDFKLAAGNAANEYGGYKGSMNNHFEFYQYVLTQITDNKYDYDTLVDSMRTVEIIEKIYDASK